MCTALLVVMLVSACSGAPSDEFMDDYMVGVGMVLDGGYGIHSSGLLSADYSKTVEETLLRITNRTALIATQAGVSEYTPEDGTMTVGESIMALNSGSHMVHNVSTLFATDEELLKSVSNTTYFTNMLGNNDDILLLLNTLSDGMSGEAVTDESNRRKLLDCATLDWDSASIADIQTCGSSALTAATSGLTSSQSNIYDQQFNLYCKPYIRTSFSEDLKDDLKDDKSMKTCNDFWGCQECIEAKERKGTYITQEDCDYISNDEQEWYLDPIDDTNFHRFRNHEEKDHCVQAPGPDGRYYTIEECDKSNELQQFEVLELNTMTGDPRIILRLGGSNPTPDSAGMCFGTEFADDDDGIKFINSPCTCLYSQVIKRDD